MNEEATTPSVEAIGQALRNADAVRERLIKSYREKVAEKKAFNDQVKKDLVNLEFEFMRLFGKKMPAA
jgi:hypothetical protein